MPSKELHHLRKAVEAAAKLVKKPVLDYREAEAEPTQRPPQTSQAPRP